MSDIEPEVWKLRAENERLRAALSVSRAQWIWSVNAKQCLEALGEGEYWEKLQAMRKQRALEP